MEWVYNGVCCALDFLDEDDVRRYGECVARLGAGESEAREDGAEAFIAGLCGRLKGFFDELFGEGTGDRLMGEGNNVGDAMRCYGDFLAFGRQQAEAARVLFAEVLGQYAPGRAMREENG